MSEQKNTGDLETWAIVEVMGHSKYAGFVRQVPMGGAAMIRVDVPELPEREVPHREFDYDKGAYLTGTQMLPQVPAFTKFLGVSAIFAITPCTEETARAAVESFRSPPMTILDVTSRRALPAPDDGDE